MVGIMEQELGLSTVHARRALGYEKKKARLKEKSVRSRNRRVPPPRRRPVRAKSDSHSEESGESSGSLDKSTSGEEDST
jgi:hypothetical protein